MSMNVCMEHTTLPRLMPPKVSGIMLSSECVDKKKTARFAKDLSGFMYT